MSVSSSTGDRPVKAFWPPMAAGIALGLDRLLMAITSSSRIEEILAFPIDRA